MTRSYLSLDHIKPALAQGGIVLVPNNRLRNHLLRAYALDLNAKAWEKPKIYSLNEWLANLWKQLQAKAYEPACVQIASRLQLQILWEKVISQSPQSATILRPQAVAEQAESARQTLELWQISDAELESHLPYFSQRGAQPAPQETPQNAALFYHWLRLFREELKKSGRVTRETSFDQIARALHEGVLLQPSFIALEGFDELPPLIAKILDATGVEVKRLPDQARPSPKIQRTQASNTDDEIRTAALWAKALLSHSNEDASKSSENLMGIQEKLIGIVVPNLGQSRQKIERIFTEVFEPQALMPQVARYTLPFNFSAGIPLGSTPMIQDFFALLNLRQKEIPLNQACDFLSSPFWSSYKNENLLTADDNKLQFSQKENHFEYLWRIETITELRKLQHLTVNLSDILYCANKAEKKFQSGEKKSEEKKFSQTFETLNHFIRSKKLSTLTATAWLNFFNELTAFLNWPGQRRLDSQEFQQLKQFKEVCDQFAQIEQPLSISQAIQYLRHLADRTPFQAQTPDSPIQILGALEAAGLQFSHLWVMGLSDDQWPPPASPNPLLPIALQRQHKMPHANAARELDIAQTLTHRYKKSADEIIFSCAVHNLENKSNAELALRPSALIRDIALTPLAAVVDKTHSAVQDYYAEIFTQKKLESFIDVQGPPLAIDEKIRGGARLLEDQANCPLVAFARWRLNAENPIEPQYGFSAMERGNLLHECLAAIWHRLKNSTQLHQITNEDLDALVLESSTACVKRLQNKHARQIGKRYAELEIERLAQLVKEWLALEQERPAFQVISIEEEREIIFNQLTLKLRLDRIDQFDNGEQMVIDYKTGSVNLKQVLDARPTQPQLALYALASHKKSADQVTAVSFAKISKAEQKFLGVGQLSGDAAKQAGIQIADDWSQQLNQWRESLSQLALEFCEGVADLRFHSKDAEKYSEELKPFLRNFDEASHDL